jgi:hypothetical protein
MISRKINYMSRVMIHQSTPYEITNINTKKKSKLKLEMTLPSLSISESAGTQFFIADF